ncbi:MAG: nucleotidyltransferase domain-containing protein [Bacteroidales bacterium]|nr:nucleotidyltransferase domain-containing protein [Bacteroidales bacterium]
MLTEEFAIKTARLFVEDCKKEGLDFYRVLLFGSVVKDKIHEWSDIDLLLISDQFNENIFDNLKLYSKVNIKYPLIETHPYSKAYYLKGDEFINQISKNGIIIT